MKNFFGSTPSDNTPQDPQANQQGASEETTSFDRVQSPYSTNAAGNPSSAQGSYYQSQSAGAAEAGQGAASEPTWAQGANTATVEKQPRTMSMKSAAALALVAAIGAGSITGVVVSKENGGSGSKTQVLDNLNQQPASNSTGSEAADGSVEKVAATVLPSVVSIQVTTRTGVAEGSGSIISSDGYVMTNNHVIADAESGQAEITVNLNDGTEYKADLVAGDQNTDVAVIKLQGASGLPVMNFGDSSALKVGQEVVAVGSPLGLSSTVTSGIVSALNRPVRAGGDQNSQSSLIDAIQTDAAINPGNSGGPLVDMSGNLIGMNSVIASTSTSSTGEAGSIGLGFAIPANFARRVASQLIESGKATQPMIGVQLQSNATVTGAKIADVTAGGPGDQAGLKAGEVITGMNGRRIDSADALIAAVRSSDFGSTITLTVGDENGDNPREVEVTLTSE